MNRYESDPCGEYIRLQQDFMRESWVYKTTPNLEEKEICLQGINAILDARNSLHPSELELVHNLD